MNIADIRKDYKLKILDEKLMIVTKPLDQFGAWLNEALESKVNEPTAMVLATTSPDGFPSSRVVLLKAFSPDGFCFFKK